MDVMPYCWVEVDLRAVKHNIEEVRNIIGENVRLMAVVKAEGYGHGIIPIAKKAVGCGVDYLGVSTLFEGITLRREGIDAPILVLTPPLPEQAHHVVEFDLHVAVSSLDLVQALEKEAIKTKTRVGVHVKVDTGFGRFGVYPNQVEEYLAAILNYHKHIEIIGIFTHLSKAAASDPSYSYKQFKVFQEVLDVVENKLGQRNIIRHIANSAATLRFSEMHLDMVRIGNLIYGQCPVKSNKKISLKNTWKFKSKIIHIKRYKKGTRIGYNGEYKAKRDSVIGIVPVGYYEGLGLEFEHNNINLSSFLKLTVKNFLKLIKHSGFKKYARVRGKKAEIIGKISMQNCFIDLTDIDGVEVGDEVELPVKRIATKAFIPRVYFDLQEEAKHEFNKKREKLVEKG